MKNLGSILAFTVLYTGAVSARALPLEGGKFHLPFGNAVGKDFKKIGGRSD